jgi:hypothetical protein
MKKLVLLSSILCLFLLPASSSAQLALQTSIDVTTLTFVPDDPNPPIDAGTGWAAVGFDGTNYWVAKWASAKMARISQAGVLVDTFEVVGLTGARSFTFDGTNLWAGNATTTITCVSPTTLTTCGTITAPAAARYISFDPTADGGNGGFWMGDFNSDIQLIDMAGNNLVTIAAGTLTTSGRYGVAFDNVTDSGPILWIFYQGGATSPCELTAIDLPSGAQRPSKQDISLSEPSLTACLAGGTFLAQNPSLPGGISLLTLLQGTPNNFLLGFAPSATFPVELLGFSIE